MVYQIIAVNKDNQSEQMQIAILRDKVCRDGKRVYGEFVQLGDGSVSYKNYISLILLQVDKKQFKVGSLDQLMEMMDSFSKQDTQLDASCRRNEATYTQTAEELNQEAKLRIERQVRGGKKEV